MADPVDPGSQSAGVVTAPEEEDIYLGVPNDYMARRRTGSEVTFDVTPGPAGLTGTTGLLPTFTNFAPRYRIGEQYAIISMDTEELMALQRHMEDAGILDAGYALGDPTDPATLSAYTELLSRSNLAGLDKKDQLAKMIAAPKAVKKKAPLTVALTHPDDIRETVRKVAGDLYGGVLPDDQVEAMVSTIQSQERTAQEQAYALDETGGTVIKPADAQTTITRRIREEHPNEVAATQFADMFDNIISTFTQPTTSYGGSKYP